MRIVLTFCLILLTMPVFSQSLEELESKLQSATSPSEKIQLNYQLAEAYLRSNVRDNEKKALPFGKEAYNLANRKRDDGQAARSAFLLARIYGGMRDQERNQELWYRTAEEYARKAGDSDLIVKSVIKRGQLANRERNYRRAAGIYEDAFNYFSQKGTSISELESRYEQEKALLEKEKATLEQERLDLQNEIELLEQESEQLNSEKTELQANQEVLIREVEEVEEAISNKEEELVSVSEAKEQAEQLAEERQEQVDELSEETLRQRLARQDAEIAAAKSRELTLLSLALAALLIFLALFLYARFVAKRKAANVLAKEKKRSDELLLNILPQEIANELKENGKAKARKYSKVSVLFSDFINFTSISEKLSPEELVEELDNCFQGFDEIISEYKDIEKIKTIGDAYMCASGLQANPGKEEESEGKPHNLIRAALKMQEFLRNRRVKRKKEGKQYFEARMGIHTGPVVAGVVGKKKFAYDIWGDTVNTASRIESNGQVDNVNISESTYDLVKDDFACEALGQIKAKNKGFLSIFRVKR